MLMNWNRKTHIDMQSYRIVRSKRKTISLQMGPDGLIVRAPWTATNTQIEEVVKRHAGWIEKQQNKISEAQKAMPAIEKLTMEEIRELADQAKKLIPKRVAYYAQLVVVNYGRITIRNQRSRWGSCSAEGNLNFNCLLMLAPLEVLDSVIVHELCHRKEPNHSKRFYAEVLRVYPDYWAWNKWLKDNGPMLIRRMTG